MKIKLKVHEFVLEGFNYHDHKRITDSTRRELTELVTKCGLAYNDNSKKDVLRIDAGSFEAPADMNPRIVGIRIASSVYRGLKRRANI